MPRYEVTVKRTVQEEATKVVEANSKLDAIELVEEMDDDQFAWKAVDVVWEGCEGEEASYRVEALD